MSTTSMNYDHYQMDVKTAFEWGSSKKKSFVAVQPEGFETKIILRTFIDNAMSLTAFADADMRDVRIRDEVRWEVLYQWKIEWLNSTSWENKLSTGMDILTKALQESVFGILLQTWDEELTPGTFKRHYKKEKDE
ncbi:hypothetical protein Tco_0951214 [Tanacetum coccineum]|uniref:Uncharacterized protein n=1 Tax=Tanacetum coccineum TaxID=301880 RepID=A0ABQ5DUD9_9ASTR